MGDVAMLSTPGSQVSVILTLLSDSQIVSCTDSGEDRYHEDCFYVELRVMCVARTRRKVPSFKAPSVMSLTSHLQGGTVTTSSSAVPEMMRPAQDRGHHALSSSPLIKASGLTLPSKTERNAVVTVSPHWLR